MEKTARRLLIANSVIERLWLQKFAQNLVETGKLQGMLFAFVLLRYWKHKSHKKGLNDCSILPSIIIFTSINKFFNVVLFIKAQPELIFSFYSDDDRISTEITFGSKWCNFYIIHLNNYPNLFIFKTSLKLIPWSLFLEIYE